MWNYPFNNIVSIPSLYFTWTTFLSTSSSVASLYVLNQEMWVDSPGGRWWLHVSCGDPISAPRWSRFPDFSQSGRRDSPGLHLVGFQEEAVWPRVSRMNEWLKGLNDRSKVVHLYPAGFTVRSCRFPPQRSIRHRSAFSVPAHSPSHWRI